MLLPPGLAKQALALLKQFRRTGAAPDPVVHGLRKRTLADALVDALDGDGRVDPAVLERTADILCTTRSSSSDMTARRSYRGRAAAAARALRAAARSP